MHDSIYLIKDYNLVIKKVDERIQKLLMISDFEPSINYLKAIHAYLFRDLLTSNGKFREYDIIKSEPTINNASIDYADYHTIETYLLYAIHDINNIDCSRLTDSEFISFIVNITLSIWITHPFSDGNTRTVSVFIQKYLNSLGYNPNPTFFKDNFTYFRKALVKAVYVNDLYGVKPDLEPLCKFYHLLLFGGNITSDESDLIVFEMFNHPKVRQRLPKVGNLIKKIWFN